MSTNRHTRNPQQLRALIQNMGRSIEEARQRRVVPEQHTDAAAPLGSERTTAQQQPGASNAAGASGAQSASAPTPSSTVATQTPGPHQMPPASPPPIRSATEMFSESTPRLKARPKRAS